MCAIYTIYCVCGALSPHHTHPTILYFFTSLNYISTYRYSSILPRIPHTVFLNQNLRLFLIQFWIKNYPWLFDSNLLIQVLSICSLHYTLYLSLYVFFILFDSDILVLYVLLKKIWADLFCSIYSLHLSLILFFI